MPWRWTIGGLRAYEQYFSLYRTANYISFPLRQNPTKEMLMAIQAAINAIKNEIAGYKKEITKLEGALKALGGITGKKKAPTKKAAKKKTAKRKPKRKMSAAARKKISAAMKKRWAKKKAGTKKKRKARKKR